MERRGAERKGSLNEENESREERPKCVFCRTNTKNKYYLGKMMSDSDSDISAHYYCILLSPGLVQNGGLGQGFKGFLKEDILKEVSRGSRLSCSYCHKRGAVIGCDVSKCRKNFHLVCGLTHDSFHSFHDPSKTYPSYCSEHRPVQRTARIGNTSNDKCAICMDQVLHRPTPKTLWSPCCGNWLHRECVLKQAYHAAKHHFKCPNCNNRKDFVEEMKAFGIHVPSRDASWEKGQTYTDMYEKTYECSAVECLQRNRSHNEDGEWELLACDGCGANAIHIRCANLDINTVEWLCSLCKPILDTNEKQKTV